MVTVIYAFLLTIRTSPGRAIRRYTHELKFGIFELDPVAGELRRNGTLVRLSPQPFQILTLLARNAGEIVDRDRIRQEVWGATAVDFDRSLNVAIAQIRFVLNDDADNPRFIQTIPRRGYRFLAAIEQPAAAKVSGRKLLPAAAAFLLLAIGGIAGYRLRPPALQPIRIAVLPFENLSLSEADTTQSDGLFDELLTRLGGIQPDRMQVIGRRSVAALNIRGAGALRQIGERLNVRYALECTARRADTGLTITARLVDTSGESVVWSGTFAPEKALQGISAATLTTLFPTAAPTPLRSSCTDGWDAYATGRQLVNRGTLKDLRHSLDYFRQASCPEARAALAETQVRLARIMPIPPDAWESARSAAQQALHADNSLALAHLALGNIAFWHDWNWQTARAEFSAALRINPSNPDAHHDEAWLDIALGQPADALAALNTALAIDPFSARTRMDTAWLLLQLGRFSEAEAAARRTLELDPDMKEANACLARAQHQPALRPARDPYEHATRLTSPDEAIPLLEEALASHNTMMPLVATDPAFTFLHGNPRFQKIVQAMHLP